MTLTFQINYRAQWGDTLCIVETEQAILGWQAATPLTLTCEGTDFWTATVPVSDFVDHIAYKYAVRHADGSMFYEDGEVRQLNLSTAQTKKVVIRDFWQQTDNEKAFESTAFIKALFHRLDDSLCIRPVRISHRLKTRYTFDKFE